MIAGLEWVVFRVPVQAGKIIAVSEHGQRLKVRTRQGYEGRTLVEVSLSRGMAMLKNPKVGDYLVEYPTGHIDVMSAVDFALKATAGVDHE